MGHTGLFGNICFSKNKRFYPYTRPPRPVYIETERLILREIAHSDLSALREILQDPETMRFHNGILNYWDVRAWLNRQIRRYKKYGFGLWAVVLKDSGIMIGQCGVNTHRYGDILVPQIGYLFNRNYWNKGYATEAAIACKDFAFSTLGFNEVFSVINTENYPSQRVAERNGMIIKDTFVKCQKGMVANMYLYSAVSNYKEQKNEL